LNMLETKQLQALAAVAEHGGFGPAAKSLSLTLAAVSLRIKTLEEQLGQRVLVRGKTVRPTAAGVALLTHHKQVLSMETDVLDQLRGNSINPAVQGKAWQTLAVAINADSLTHWFLAGVANTLRTQKLLLDIRIDDQDHTHDALKSGEVTGCITTLPTAMRGCVAEPLGLMRYHCVASPEVVQTCKNNNGQFSVHRLLAQPAIIFNRKDALQDLYLAQHFGIKDAHYPRHFAPAVDAFEKAITLGLGWGMVPQAKRDSTCGWEELANNTPVDVMLYWQHWARESRSAQVLTHAVKQAAALSLLPA
jgi:LysR family transcriptional regulator, chromosome initiation inhibitor